MAVEGRKSYYGTSTASPTTRDAVTHEIHETRVQDMALSARVADACESGPSFYQAMRATPKERVWSDWQATNCDHHCQLE